MNTGVSSQLRKSMSRPGQNEKSLFFNRLFGIKSLSLAGTHAIKATNRDSINSIKRLTHCE